MLLFVVIKAQTQDFDPVLKGKIDDFIEQSIEENDPGIAVGIIQNGQLVYEHYVGYANLEYQIKVNEKTRFNIASNAKQFTALCILKLVEQGKLRLDDDIRTYLPDIHPSIPEKITIAQLINHSSGIRDYCDLLALTGKSWWKQFIDNEDALELLKGQRDLNFKPGTEYGYSNSNYILLTEIIHKVTGQDFSEVALALFKELDMPHTAFLTHYSAIVPDRARPYGKWNGWQTEPTVTGVHGDGALFTTLADQLRWEQIIQINDGAHLPQSLIRKTQAPMETSVDDGYGYGLMFQIYRGLEHSYHDGVTGAYRASFLRFPTKKLSVVLLSNNRNIRADVIATQVVHLVLGLEDENKTYPDKPGRIEKLTDVQPLLGFYKSDGGSIIQITQKDGALYRTFYQRDPVKLVPEQGGLFAYETIEGLTMNFTNIGQSNQQFTLYATYQPPYSYQKLLDQDLNTFDKQALNGRFYNDETDTEIRLKFVEGTTYTLTKNGRERTAELILEDYLRMMDVYHIRILRDAQDKIIGLNVERDRIKNVIFTKK